jgi:hypothetical protein
MSKHGQHIRHLPKKKPRKTAGGESKRREMPGARLPLLLNYYQRPSRNLSILLVHIHTHAATSFADSVWL